MKRRGLLLIVGFVLLLPMLVESSRMGETYADLIKRCPNANLYGAMKGDRRNPSPSVSGAPHSEEKPSLFPGRTAITMAIQDHKQVAASAGILSLFFADRAEISRLNHRTTRP